MKDENVKLGMKVVPHSKTAEKSRTLEESPEWNMAKEHGQPYLFVNGSITDNNPIWLLGYYPVGGGDFFHANDFEPYLEEKPTTSYFVAGDLPTRITRRHDTYAEAEAEAKRLCLQEGKAYHVLKVVAIVEPAQPTIIRIEE